MSFFRQLLSNRKANIGLTLLGVFVLIATIGPYLVRDASEFLTTPLSPPDSEFWLFPASATPAPSNSPWPRPGRRWSLAASRTIIPTLPATS